MTRRSIILFIMAATALSFVATAGPTPVGTAFTYQGQLKQAGTPVTGTFDFEFRLFDVPTGGTAIDTLIVPGLPVTEGVFTVDLDFGDATFDGTARWLAMTVEGTALEPRQEIKPVPYALFALNGDNLWNQNGTSISYADGDVGIGTTTPAEVLHVSANDAILVLQDSTPFSSPTPHIRFRDSNSNEMGRVGYDVFGSQALSITNSQFNGKLRFLTQNIERMTIGENGGVGIGTATPGGDFEVRSAFGRYFRFSLTGVSINRQENGTLMNFTVNDAIQGSISVAGATVSYNGFMGSHYAWMDGEKPIDRGALVRMTGENRRLNDSAESDAVYGIEPTTIANDPACLGAYLGIMEPDKPADLANPHLVAAVGNGEMLVVDSGTGDIQPGDYLISADVGGCAMKDDPKRFPVGHVVARAAQYVDWSGVTPEANGRKVARVSVFFEGFMRDRTPIGETAELRAEKDAEIVSLQVRMAALEKLVSQMHALQTGSKP